ncbi:quinoprotein dehydrogenase-associated SoxYZ-like carrier [Leptothrix discophora]|uniref:Quinoprotein dehydrogenase-associated SoxYZ-like carrier n=1 Tax=Leptothrix discophora TaxID=89 RepID=A0ABT9G8E0_LEPDI|nr:quinoprotein dehydrogenase-associated SoxYZ-like carrier [Leptothrix discophora]MDP4302758.1 quinoprotein dehydrogenase-associated SoxYZ-like carrier [Leptothrix discophora]
MTPRHAAPKPVDTDRRQRLAQGLAFGAMGWAGLTGLAGPAQAAVGGLPTNVGHGDSSPQWESLRERLFGGQPIAAGAASQVQLVVPLRAAYGASVPVRIVSKLAPGDARRVRRMTLLVDKNPSPVAATLTLGEALGPANFETRLRVDEYSHIRVVHQLDDGSLHMDSRYVKVSGGCSAPPNRESPHLIGKTLLRLPEGLHRDAGGTAVDLTVLHPNDTGFELNQVTVMYIPPHFVRSIQVRLGGRPVFDADMDFSVSENPSWRFQLAVPGEGRVGRLSADIEDSKELRTRGELDLDQAGVA